MARLSRRTGTNLAFRPNRVREADDSSRDVRYLTLALYVTPTRRYVFAKGSMSLGLGTASCVYSLVKSGEDEAVAVPLYDVAKVGRMGLSVVFTNQEGTVVAKYAQPGWDVKKNVAEIGAGVDYAAVCLIAGMIGAATGSGGAAVGALVGAGAI